MTDRAARYTNMAFATWLLISAFLWRHGEAQFLVTSLVGAVVVVITPFALWAPRVRLANVACGLGLAGAARVLPHASAATVWHNVIVGLAIAAVALVGPRITLHHRSI